MKGRTSSEITPRERAGCIAFLALMFLTLVVGNLAEGWLS